MNFCGREICAICVIRGSGDAIASASPALATWSIVAVDQPIGTVVIASATCVPQNVFACSLQRAHDPQAIVVLAGVAAAQAAADPTRRTRNGSVELDKATAPDRSSKSRPIRIEYRQFGIVDLQGRVAAFSGSKNGPAALNHQGQVAGTGVFYAIQGNILAGDDVVTAAEAALKSATGTLADRVMAAMEAADAKGGDKRCSCTAYPRPTMACETKTSQVAYLLRAEAKDQKGSGVNDGQYAMYLSVTNEDIQPAENANPVKTLRLRYDAWKKAHPR